MLDAGIAHDGDAQARLGAAEGFADRAGRDVGKAIGGGYGVAVIVPEEQKNRRGSAY